MNKSRINQTAQNGASSPAGDRTGGADGRNIGRRIANFDNLDKKALYNKIQELRFVKTELELYLDTHPNCRVALDYYYQTVEALRDLYERYSVFDAPLFAAEVQGDKWSWVGSPWPWHRSEDNSKEGEK